MKRYLYVPTAFLGLFGILTVSSQEGFDALNGLSPSIKKHTLMDRFEPDLTLTASEREVMKAERFAEIKAKMQMLDTLNISEREREMLIEELIEDPFSTRLAKALADIKYESEN